MASSKWRVADHRHILALLLALLLTLTGCGRESVIQSQSYVFGTLVDISIYGESDTRAQALATHIEQEFQRLHHSLHAWKDGSDLSRLNAAFAAGETATVTPELARILANATALSEQSGDLFNPAIGGLIQLWGFQRDEYTPVNPDSSSVQSLVDAHPTMRDLVLVGSTVRSKNKAVRLDLGGYAKGYALDLAADYLRQQKVKGALVNIGGNIIAVGRHGDRPWRVGIQHPRRAGPLATLELPDGWAIGTSGDYQRFFMRDGHRYCHLIDPRSGQPSAGAQAVTVLVPPGPQAGGISDAASKPLFISGATGWREAASRMNITYALFVDVQGKIDMTPAMRPLVHLETQHASD